MRVFILSPSEKTNWRSPAEVVANWCAIFDNVIADADAAKQIGELAVAQAARFLSEKSCDPQRAKNAVAMLRRRYEGALVVEAWDDDEELARFRTEVRTDVEIYLEFVPTAKYQQKRKIAKKAAEAIGYRAEYSDEI